MRRRLSHRQALLGAAALALALAFAPPGAAGINHGSAAGGGGGGSPVNLGVARNTSGTTLDLVALAGCGVGSTLVVGVTTGPTTFASTTVSDLNTETWVNTGDQATGIGEHTTVFTATLTNAFSSGGTVRVTTSGSTEKLINAACAPGTSGVDKTNRAGATSNAPAVTIPSAGSLSSQPQFIFTYVFAEGAISTANTMSGYTNLNEQFFAGGAPSGTYGTQLYFQRVTSTAQTTPALSNLSASAQWTEHAVTIPSS